MNYKEIAYELVSTKEENPSLIVTIDGKAQALHSKVYPSKEADSMRSDLEVAAFDTCFVLGVGVGYHLIALLEFAAQYKNIVLIDILPSARANIESSKACKFLLEKENIRLLSGLSLDKLREALPETLFLDENEKIKILTHAASMRIFGEYYEAVRNEIMSFINSKAGNMATLRAFGRQYARNSIKNIANMPRMYPVKNLREKFSNKSAIVITSGPTAEKSMCALAEAASRVFIIAVDSALPVCAAFGLRPDFVVSVDPQSYISEHLAGFWDEPLKVITSLSAWPCKLSNTKSNWQVFCSLNSHPLAQLIEEFSPNSVGSINSGSGSVAGDALLFAIYCGFSQIALTGFDFAFIDGIIYSRGTAYQRRYAEIFQNRLSSAETLNFNYIKKSSLSVRENGLYTRRVFGQYKKSIEELLQGARDSKLFHIDPPLVALESCEQSTMDEFLRMFCKTDIDKQQVASISAKPLQDTIDFSKLMKLLEEDEIFNKLMTASLGETNKSYDSFREMLRSVIVK